MSASNAADDVVGRSRELALLKQFVEAIGGDTLGIEVRGVAGSGKTVLWREGVRLARDRAQVLTFRAVEAEARLGFTAISDLLQPVLDDHLGELSPPQRRALDVAFLRADPDEPLEPRAIGSGIEALLRRAAKDRPVVVAIDDVQWIDGPSERALQYAARRLIDHRVGFLLSRRVEPTEERVQGWFAPLDGARTVDLGELPESELRALLEARTGARLPGSLISWVHRLVGGNPLYALELVREVDPRALAVGNVPAPPPSLVGAVGKRVLALPAPTRVALAAAAALGRPRIETLEQAIGAAAHKAAVRDAESAGVVRIEDGEVRFSHPLFGAAVYASIGPPERRAVHRALADAVEDPEDRARHLALGSAGADEAVAAALDGAAIRADARGAPESAAELAQRAVVLTRAADPESRARRRVAAATYHHRAGETARAKEVLEDVVATAPPGVERAHALHLLGWIRMIGEPGAPVGPLFEEALIEAGTDIGVSARVKRDLALHLAFNGETPKAIALERQVVAEAEQAGDDELLAIAMAGLALKELNAGVALDREGLMRACAIADRTTSARARRVSYLNHATALLEAGNTRAARQVLEDLLRWIDAHGDEAGLALALNALAGLQLHVGEWDEMARNARKSLGTAAATEQDGARAEASYMLALLAAARGEFQEAERLAAEFSVFACGGGVRGASWMADAVQSFIHLSAGNHLAAHERLNGLPQRLDEVGVRRPSALVADDVECLVALGDAEAAQTKVAWLVDRAVPFPTRADGSVARAQGLLAAALGDVDAAVKALQAAARHDTRDEAPFQHARTMLVLGTVERRDGRRRAAREALTSAITIFDGLGAAPWAARARAELARIGGRTSTAGLTPTEDQVARLAAGGATNGEIAGALFMSVKTVEANLTRIYRKLDVPSRRGLAKRLADEPRS